MKNTDDMPTVLQLIAKYVPTKTQAAFYEMAMRYEEEIELLLRKLHWMDMEMQAQSEFVDKLKVETYEQSNLRFPKMVVQAELNQDIHRMEMLFRVRWQPDQRQLVMALPDMAVCDRGRFPAVFKTVAEEAARRASLDVGEQVLKQFDRLYHELFHRKAA